MTEDPELPDLEARTAHLSVSNGEVQAEIEPADKTAESMAEVATVSHHEDEAGDGDDDDAASVSASTISMGTVGSGSGKKKKKKTKSRSKRGIGKPTGFEEFYAEGPMTPAQHAQDLEDFSPDLPFINRILRAIQRFERSKRMESERRDIFYKYLAYGGIDVGPNMFQGSISVDNKDDSLDKETINTALAQTSIAQDKYDIDTPTAKYAVDFTACASAFLSRRSMFYYGFETLPQVELVTSVLEKFMTYLLHHTVCPEYTSDILSARAVIQKATTELYKIAQVSSTTYRGLPGDFNIAASTLFNGSYATHYDGISSWDPDPTSVPNPEPSFMGFTRPVAEQIFGLAIATVGTEKQYEDFVASSSTSIATDPSTPSNDAYEVIEVKENAGFEITELVAATEAHMQFYKTMARDFRPVGIMYAKPWVNRANEGREDLTPAERAERQLHEQQLASAAAIEDNDPLLGTPSWHSTSESSRYTFFMEGSTISRFLFVGMKVEATLRKLRCGIWFMDEFRQAFASFDTWLANELMVGWKEPRERKGVVCWRGEGMGPAWEEGEEGEDDDDENREGKDSNGIGEQIRESIVDGSKE